MSRAESSLTTGQVTITVTIPASTPAGRHTLIANDPGGRHAQATITVS